MEEIERKNFGGPSPGKKSIQEKKLKAFLQGKFFWKALLPIPVPTHTKKGEFEGKKFISDFSSNPPYPIINGWPLITCTSIRLFRWPKWKTNYSAVMHKNLHKKSCLTWNKKKNIEYLHINCQSNNSIHIIVLNNSHAHNTFFQK